jgi:hypothetical protein
MLGFATVFEAAKTPVVEMRIEAGEKNLPTPTLNEQDKTQDGERTNRKGETHNEQVVS